MGHRLYMHQSKSAEDAKAYFKHALSQADYFLHEHGEIVGQWHGKGAAMLGLDGAVTYETFASLVENRNPLTGNTLTCQDDPKRRPGYDFNFRAPKSVSVAYELTGDSRIRDVFQDVVQDTMLTMERDMKTRVRVNGKNEDRTTGNMVWAKFIHTTARPVDGVPDPHVHAHCYVLNATYDAVEKKRKAGQFGELKRDALYYEAVFDTCFAARLKELGYGIERTADGWEIAGVSREVIEKFSRRLAQINEKAQEKGVNNDLAKRKFSATTREDKQENLTQEALKIEWESRLTDEEKAALNTLEDQGGDQHITPDEAMHYALSHAFARKSVISEKQLMTQGLRYGVGSVDVEGIQGQMARPEIIKRDVFNRRMVTTQEVVDEEKRMISFARAGQGIWEALGTGTYQWKKHPEHPTQDFLNSGQKNAVNHVLQSHNRVIAIRGGAGVGKTELMKEAVAGIEEGSKSVFTFAPSSDASRGELRKVGFANAQTVQRLLDDTEMQRQMQGNVIWVDEAGLLSSLDMSRLFEIADRQGARVVLSGDVRQHTAVARGDALRTLEQFGGVRSVEVTDNVRQRDAKAYKQAVTLFSKGDILNGFAQLDTMHAIEEIAQSDERYRKVADDYLHVISEKKRNGEYKTALVVSPTHAEGAEVTGLIRARLRDAGRLGTEERGFLQQRSVNWTEAQRMDGRNYDVGHIVQFHQNAKGGFKRGQKARVVDRDLQGNVHVRNRDTGKIMVLRLDQAAKFQVYEESMLSLAKGDTIRITQNGYSRNNKRLNNGAVYEVKGLTDTGDIELSNGFILDKDYGNLAHGYVTTSHASQGKTVDRVLIAQGTQSLAASSQEQWYVSVSRGREGVSIYTDDKEALQEAVQHEGVRMGGLELLAQGRPANDDRARMPVPLAAYIKNAMRKGLEAVVGAGRHAVQQVADRGRGFER